MSKSVSILEGGTSKQFGTTAKLRTNLSGGGTCDWVPEDDVQLGTKNITENGTYYAEDDGYYGYSEVTVNGVGGTTFTAQEGDQIGGVPLEPNEDYWVEVGGGEGGGDGGGDDGGGGGGEMTVTELPSAIAFTTAPIRVNYYDGDAVNLAGSVVQAFKNSGELWTNEDYPQGAIPYGQLALIPPNADYSKVTVEERGWDGVQMPRHTRIDEDHFDFPIVFSNPNIVLVNGSKRITYQCNADTAFIITDGDNEGFNVLSHFLSLTPFTVHIVITDTRTGEVVDEITRSSDGPSTTLSGETTFYDAYIGSGSPYFNSTVAVGACNQAKIAIGVTNVAGWAAVYYEGEVISRGGQQDIMVRWNRVGDRKALYTTLPIYVSPSSDE